MRGEDPRPGGDSERPPGDDGPRARLSQIVGERRSWASARHLRVEAAVVSWVALAVALTPNYVSLWWWDLLAHALGALAVVWVVLDLSGSWELSLAVLVAAGLGLEVVEFTTGWFIVGYADTLTDLAVELGVWFALRGGALVGSTARDRDRDGTPAD